jgi:transposase
VRKSLDTTAGDKKALVVWRTGAWKLEIVKRSHAAGFEVLPKRWIVERTFGWMSPNRRLARDFERYATTVAAFIRLRHDPHHAEATCCKRLVMNPIFLDGL